MGRAHANNVLGLAPDSNEGVRDMITREQAISASEFHENEPRPNGTCYHWRRNGQTKVWKTRPLDFEVPVKYGLRAYGYITKANAANFHLPTDTCK